MANTTELQALQNAANKVHLTVKEDQPNDKRKTLKRYFLVDEFGNGVSPVLDYDNLNHFILGWIKAIQVS